MLWVRIYSQELGAWYVQSTLYPHEYLFVDLYTGCNELNNTREYFHAMTYLSWLERTAVVSLVADLVSDLELYSRVLG